MGILVLSLLCLVMFFSESHVRGADEELNMSDWLHYAEEPTAPIPSFKHHRRHIRDLERRRLAILSTSRT